MNWQKYYNTFNPAIQGEGYWTDVPYLPPLLTEKHPTKGFIATDGFLIKAIGHVWFPEQEPAASQYFTFNDSSRITGEYIPNKIILIASMEKINPALTDKLIFLATSFRDEYADNFTESLDRCVKEIVRMTEQR